MYKNRKQSMEKLLNPSPVDVEDHKEPDYKEALDVARQCFLDGINIDIFYFDNVHGKGMFTVNPMGIINRSRK